MWSGVAIHPVRDISAIAGTTSNAAGARPRNCLRCGCPRETSQTSTGAFLQRSGRELRTGIVDGPAADHRDRYLSPSLCFVAFVRLNNLAQNHFRNVSASCAGDPCWSLLKAPGVAMTRSSRNRSSPLPAWCACAACIACSARMRGRLRTPCSNSPASRVHAGSRTEVEFRGPIHSSPSGSLPRPFGPRGSVLLKIGSRQHISLDCWSGFCSECRRTILAWRLSRCRRHRSQVFAHWVLYLTTRVVRGPERGPRTVAQEDTNHPRCTSSSGPSRRWLSKSPNGVAAMPARVLRSGCAAPQAEPAPGRGVRGFIAPRYRTSGYATHASATHSRSKLSTGGLRLLPALCDSAPHTPLRRPSWTGFE